MTKQLLQARPSSLGITPSCPSSQTSVQTSSRYRYIDESARRDIMSWASGTSFDPPSAAAALVSPVHTSPTAASPVDDERARKRKRSSVAGADNGEADNNAWGAGHGGIAASNGGASLQGSPTANGKPRHQPGVKRACNDCRQQKVRPHFRHTKHFTLAVSH